MREVVKTNVKRNESSKRTRRRRRNMPLYVFLVFLLVLAIGVTLSITLFFNINTITVRGESDYSNDDIISVSGIRQGDNLVRLDAKGAEKRILASMIYIEEADVKKKYPDSIEISITRSRIAACVSCDDGFLLVSSKGRILDKVSETDSSLMRIDGFEPANETLGTNLKSSDEQKDSIVLELLDAIFSKEKQRVRQVDMTDKYDIKVNFEDRITFEMGNSNDIAYKLELADTVLDDMSGDKTGTMSMVGTNQISFRSSNDKATGSGARIPVSDEDMPDSGVAPPGGNATDPSSDNGSESPDENTYSDEYPDEDTEEVWQEDEYYEDEYYEDEYYSEDEEYDGEW
ncbi:MAG: cell division protein FtsQ/DivIB [Porcipelethomonas sp.]